MISVARVHTTRSVQLVNDTYRRRANRTAARRVVAAHLPAERAAGDRDRLRRKSPDRAGGNRDHRRRQLASMPVIEQAKGMIMTQRRVSEKEAFRLLRRASQHTNTRLADLAAAIVRREDRTSGAPLN